ncbi:uncharacterized protein ACRADG_006257 [Cochliomyia hominivorax]
MGNVKDIFKIILVMQFLACTLAHYGHPDAETIDFGSPTQPSRDQMIIEAAIKRGMDGDAIAELLRTRKPVVRTTTTPEGFTKTTTYKLEPDGSISSKSLLQKRHRYVYNSDKVPDDIPIDELRNSPTGTITRTYIDSDGSKVTQTIGVSKPKPSTVIDPDDLTGDWFNKPFPAWPEETAPVTNTRHRTITRTYTRPNGERRTVQTWNESPVHRLTPHLNNRPATRTYSRPTNVEPFEINSKPKFPNIGDIDWPTIEDPEDEDGWEVVEEPEVEATTKKSPQAWTPKTWEWPEFPTRPTTAATTTTSTSTSATTTARPKLYIEPEPPTPKQLPSLEEFLKSQYGKPSNSAPTTTTTTTTTSKTTTNIPQTSTTTPASSPTTKVINIEDLPVVEVLHNGKPADESIIKNLPPHLTPQPQTDHILKIENKHPIDADIEVYTPKIETNVRTYSKTHVGPEKPKLQDLDPQMQEILRKAGISPDDITNIDGDTITKTRVEPDGRRITTTYKVKSVPASPPVEHITPVQHHYVRPQSVPHSYNTYQPHPALTPSVPLTPHLSPISDFLARLGLTRYDITSRNNRYTQTFMDENGDVLTATFVLTPGRNRHGQQKPFK